jgi:ABC-type sulfate transport system permease component
MQTRVVTALLVAALIYFAFLFAQPVLDHLASQLSQRFGVWAKIASGTVGAATLTSILASLLFAVDSALMGQNKTAQWVRTDER